MKIKNWAIAEDVYITGAVGAVYENKKLRIQVFIALDDNEFSENYYRVIYGVGKSTGFNQYDNAFTNLKDAKQSITLFMKMYTDKPIKTYTDKYKN